MRLSLLCVLNMNMCLYFCFQGWSVNSLCWLACFIKVFKMIYTQLLTSVSQPSASPASCCRTSQWMLTATVVFVSVSRRLKRQLLWTWRWTLPPAAAAWAAITDIQPGISPAVTRASNSTSLVSETAVSSRRGPSGTSVMLQESPQHLWLDLRCHLTTASTSCQNLNPFEIITNFQILF